jgi:hypothetical protein
MFIFIENFKNNENFTEKYFTSKLNFGYMWLFKYATPPKLIIICCLFNKRKYWIIKKK